MVESTSTFCTVKVAGEAQRLAWDGFVARHPAATFFHQWGYRQAVETCFGHRPHYLLAERDGEVAGLLPLFELNSRLFGHSLVSLPFAVYGGALAVDSEVRRPLHPRQGPCPQSERRLPGATLPRTVGICGRGE